MILKNNGIFNVESWFQIAPPMGGERQWKDGRSAKELARYITTSYPYIPQEIERILSCFVDEHAQFDWAAEYVTEFQPFGLGIGEGRNHDAFMYNGDIVVGIEGKADEPFGSQLIGEALETASDNKKQRINGMIHMLFGDAPENHKHLRYQLVTASVATLLESKKRQVQKALLLVIVFKKDGCYREKNIAQNNADIQRFLTDISAKENGEYYTIPTVYGKENNIELYFKHIEISLR